jgi:simple sugar transport system permease protein
MRWLTHYFRTSEGVILLTTLLLCTVIGFLNPVFLSAANLLDLVRDSITTGIFALAVYVALLSGGIDVSFTSIAATAMYGSVKFFVLTNPHAPLLPIFLLAAAIGAVLGSINGLLIAIFRLPTLIVTLGTLSFFHGFLLTFLGSKHITDIPDSMLDLSRSFLYRGRLADGSLFSLPTTSLFLIAAIVLIALLAFKTSLGAPLCATRPSRSTIMSSPNSKHSSRSCVTSSTGVWNSARTCRNTS